MTTLNARATNAYLAAVDDGGPFDSKTRAYETGWEDGYKAARQEAGQEGKGGEGNGSLLGLVITESDRVGRQVLGTCLPAARVPQRIQLRRTKGWKLAPNARAVTRPHYYGNPYRIGDFYILGDPMPFPIPTARSQESEDLPGDLRVQRCHSAEQAVVWYREYAAYAMEPDKLELLRGMDLACWCPLDQACHADVLLELANGESS